MGRKRTPGLYKRGAYWHIDKRLFGRRLSESTGTSRLEQAEIYLARRVEELRHTIIYGERLKRTFREAAMKYLLEHQHKRSIKDDALHIKVLDPFIGEKSLAAIHIGTLQPFIKARRQQGLKTRTINYGLQVTRRILNLAATEWMDEYGLTWLHHAPKIKLLPLHDARLPHPLSWQEQTQLFHYLPVHLERMALFAVNTGCRDREICALRWEWEVPVPELNTSVFIIPKHWVKNAEDRLVVLNSIAVLVIESVRGQHPERVFTYRTQPIKGMLNSAWQRARQLANLPQVRVHDLKHTFGRRLRAAGVSFEDRQDLLGHKSARMTTHYSAAELGNLIDAANTVCGDENNRPQLTLLRTRDLASSRKSPATEMAGSRQIV